MTFILNNNINSNFSLLGNDLMEHFTSVSQRIAVLHNETSDSSNSIKELIETSTNAINQKLQSVFQSVSNGKKLLASALLTKGVSVAEDATFAQIAQAILSIPQKMVIGVQEIPGEISYDYHYHVDKNGSFPHTNTEGTSGGCYTIAQYHVHTGSSNSGSGCYTIPITHTHSNSCYSEGNHNDSCPRHTERHSYDCGTVHDWDGDGHGCDGFTAWDCGGA